ncbi:hypothetical protein [Cryobacterium tepidiphilum]|uniref:PH domain-containing protein n=1 Tax=Cryobacterium tepidiphilum TaxID=2486026 RepID=A0A3M8LB88_9MICO|nr:hypothetical protein [Cryobacterium tepidiphilum]RNE62219.1 hypothetical protein EEJ31_09045 [Cryobacterium tepidiphilum]
MPDRGSPFSAPEPISGQTLRPHAPIVKQWAVAVIAFVAPILVALYWLSVPNGNWPAVLAAHLSLTAVAAIGAVSYSLVSLTVDPAGIRRRDGLGRVRSIPADDMGRLLQVQLSRTVSSPPQLRLFVLGADHRLLAHMHGAFWSSRSLEAVVDALPVPMERIDEPMTLAQFNHEWPGLLCATELRFLPSPDDDDDDALARPTL